MSYQKEPNALTCGQRRWNSHGWMPISEAAQPLYHRVYREIAREIETGHAPAGRSPAVRALVLRRARRQPRDRAPGARGADGRRTRDEPRARLGRHRRRGARAAEHAHEPVRGGALARARRERARARRRRPPRDDRRGGGVRDRARRRGVRAAPAADARRPADLDRRQPGAAPPAAGRARHGLQHGLALRGTRPRRPRARPRGLPARGARRGRLRGGAARPGAGRAGPVRDHGGDRRGRPGHRPRPYRVSGGSLSVPGDADAPRSPGREGDRQ